MLRWFVHLCTRFLWLTRDGEFRFRYPFYAYNSNIHLPFWADRFIFFLFQLHICCFHVRRPLLFISKANWNVRKKCIHIILPNGKRKNILTFEPFLMRSVLWDKKQRTVLYKFRLKKVFFIRSDAACILHIVYFMPLIIFLERNLIRRQKKTQSTFARKKNVAKIHVYSWKICLHAKWIAFFLLSCVAVEVVWMNMFFDSDVPLFFTFFKSNVKKHILKSLCILCWILGGSPARSNSVHNPFFSRAQSTFVSSKRFVTKLRNCIRMRIAFRYNPLYWQLSNEEKEARALAAQREEMQHNFHQIISTFNLLINTWIDASFVQRTQFKRNNKRAPKKHRNRIVLRLGQIK